MSRKINDQFGCSKMMLPEHRAKLYQHHHNQQLATDNPPPNHDEQQWMEYQLLLEQSLSHSLKISLSYWTKEQISTFHGQVIRLEQATGTIYLATVKGTKQLASTQVLEIVAAQIP